MVYDLQRSKVAHLRHFCDLEGVLKLNYLFNALTDHNGVSVARKILTSSSGIKNKNGRSSSSKDVKMVKMSFILGYPGKRIFDFPRFIFKKCPLYYLKGVKFSSWVDYWFTKYSSFNKVRSIV